jgi:hypothetical protein
VVINTADKRLSRTFIVGENNDLTFDGGLFSFVGGTTGRYLNSTIQNSRNTNNRNKKAEILKGKIKMQV